ncbi:MAG: sulfite exporter TauE/SafE family protein [Pseudomonadota bacterium]
MTAEPATFAVAAAAALIAGVSKGGFGGGVGFVSTMLLALIAPPAVAVAVMLPILILIDQASMAAYWRRWSRAAIRAALPAAAVGIGIGALLFGAVDADALRLALGLIALAFLAFQLARDRGWAPPSEGGRPARAAIWGGAAGLTSTLSHAGGPPVAIYLLGEKLDKTTYQASSVLLFWAINLMKVGPYAALGVFSEETLILSTAAAPAALIGVVLGIWLHKRAPERIYLRLMAALLFVTGLKLVWDGASGLL